MESCKSCRFYSEGGSISPYYNPCRRHPVTVDKRETDWCGEYESRHASKGCTASYTVHTAMIGTKPERQFIAKDGDWACSQCDWVLTGHADTATARSFHVKHDCTNHQPKDNS